MSHEKFLIFHQYDSGLALEAMITLLTIQFIPFFMLTWIIGESPRHVSPYTLLTTFFSQRICICLPPRNHAIYIPVRKGSSLLQRLPGDARHHLRHEERCRVLIRYPHRVDCDLVYHDATHPGMGEKEGEEVGQGVGVGGEDHR